MSGSGSHLGILTRAFAARLVERETSQASIAQVQFLIWTIALLTLPLLRVPLGAWQQYMHVCPRDQRTAFGLSLKRLLHSDQRSPWYIARRY